MKGRPGRRTRLISRQINLSELRKYKSRVRVFWENAGPCRDREHEFGNKEKGTEGIGRIGSEDAGASTSQECERSAGQQRTQREGYRRGHQCTRGEPGGDQWCATGFIREVQGGPGGRERAPGGSGRASAGPGLTG